MIAAGLVPAIWAVAFSAQRTERVVEHRQMLLAVLDGRGEAELILVEVGHAVDESARAPQARRSCQPSELALGEGAHPAQWR
jgi:hypothetical protein